MTQCSNPGRSRFFFSPGVRADYIVTGSAAKLLQVYVLSLVDSCCFSVSSLVFTVPDRILFPIAMFYQNVIYNVILLLFCFICFFNLEKMYSLNYFLLCLFCQAHNTRSHRDGARGDLAACYTYTPATPG